jgi:hypothetical protein
MQTFMGGLLNVIGNVGVTDHTLSKLLETVTKRYKDFNNIVRNLLVVDIQVGGFLT